MEKWLKYSLVLVLCFFFCACKQTPKVGSQDSKIDQAKVEESKSNILAPPPSKQSGPDISEFLEPQKEKNDFDRKEWREIVPYDSMTVLDLRYATENNFTKQQIYDCARCFLRPVVKKQLLGFREHMLNKHDLGIILYDCYRPRPYQQKLWDIVPDPRFVGDPAKGSMHNRGMAVDIGLIDRNGNILDMGTDFDHFGKESFHSATNISKEAIKNRKLLKKEIGLYGFKPITSEWWHYSYREDIGELSEWLWSCD